MTRRWVPVLAVLVLVPLTLGITFQNEWVSYYQSRPSQPVEVAAGEAIDFGGAGWQVSDVAETEASSELGEEIGLPAHTRLVTVTVEVTPGEPIDGLSPYCMATLQELDGDRVVRNWDDATFANIDYYPEDPVEWGCTTELTRPYTFEAWFVIPDDAGEQLSLSLEVSEQQPRYLRLAL